MRSSSSCEQARTWWMVPLSIVTLLPCARSQLLYHRSLWHGATGHAGAERSRTRAASRTTCRQRSRPRPVDAGSATDVRLGTRADMPRPCGLLWPCLLPPSHPLCCQDHTGDRLMEIERQDRSTWPLACLQGLRASRGS
jgi:hypothetical protein